MLQERVKPGKGQESVWDYPRPPRLEKTEKHLKIIHRNVVIADTTRAFRVLETSHPPVYYIPPEDVRMDMMIPAKGQSLCEWKGRARYYSLKAGDDIVEKAAWAYPDPTEEFRPVKDYLAFYAFKLDACYVDGERVKPQPGEFYGGWITSDVVGPFKGEHGTMFW